MGFDPWTAGAAALGGALASRGKKGGGGGSGFDAAEDVVFMTRPTRGLLADQAGNFLEGKYDPTKNPMFGALKDTVESQFGRAKQNVIANTPQGGALAGALSNLEGQRASQMTQGIGDLYQNELNNAFRLAEWGVPASGDVNSAEALRMQQAQQQSQQKQTLGAGIGGLIGSGALDGMGNMGSKGSYTNELYNPTTGMFTPQR